MRAVLAGLALVILGPIDRALAEAGAGSAFRLAAFAATSAHLPTGPSDRAGSGGASLFAGRQGASLFAPRPKRGLSQAQPLGPRGHGPRDRIRHVIAQAEAGRAGYDAVQYAARIKPPRKPTELTIAEIYAWIAATPGQHHAIGRYQFIPATLKRLVRMQGIDPQTRFSPAVQDRLADQLLDEAGYVAHAQGRMSRRDFMRNLAKIWAGLPLPSGRSHYEGYAGNRATMTWAKFEAEMAQAFPG